jgi:hypothetical protein
MASRPSLAGRALAAVLLMIGFYALALIIIGVLVAVPIAEGRILGHLEFRSSVFCVLGVLAILRGILPRVDKFAPPGQRFLSNGRM